MQTSFKTRMTEEHEQLLTRLHALNKFLDGDAFRQLDETNIRLLLIQRDAMRTYATVLEMRIAINV